MTEVRRKVWNLADAIADGVSAGGVPDLLRELQAEEGTLAEEIARCQVEAQQSVQFSIELLRTHIQSVSEQVQDAPQDEMQAIYQGLFRLSYDPEKQSGRLLMVLAADATEVNPRERGGRSARI